MRILALYDIHGNREALDAVLADPRAAGADAVVVGGDAVPGPFDRDVLDRLVALDVPVHWVRGNGEREVAEAVGAPPSDDFVAQLSARGAAALGEERARALGELPLTLELDGVLFCHATPRSDAEILTRISPERRWMDALAGVTAPLVVAGHTHQQDDRMVGALRFVNAGSVGLPYEGDGAVPAPARGPHRARPQRGADRRPRRAPRHDARRPVQDAARRAAQAAHGAGGAGN